MVSNTRGFKEDKEDKGDLPPKPGQPLPTQSVRSIPYIESKLVPYIIKCRL